MAIFTAGHELGKYKILRLLGSGGMADVYEAQDTLLGRHVALKVLPAEYSRNDNLVQRFETEVKQSALLNHRSIVSVYDFGQDGPYLFYSMRLLTGGDLRKRIEAGLTPFESLGLLRELADAFVHAHKRTVHRDVKPENIVFDEQGLPVLTDFGIAKALDASAKMTATGVTVGTPRYLSPEQARGKPVDKRADIYSLGVILYEMLTGKPPYDADEALAVIFKHVTEPIPVLPEGLETVQPLLEAMMEKDPTKRIASCEDLIGHLDELIPSFMPEDLGRMRSSPWMPRLSTPSPMRTPGGGTPPTPVYRSGNQPTVITAPPVVDPLPKRRSLFDQPRLSTGETLRQPDPFARQESGSPSSRLGPDDVTRRRTPAPRRAPPPPPPPPVDEDHEDRTTKLTRDAPMPAEAAPPARASAKQKRKALIAIAATALVAIGGGAAWFMRGPKLAAPAAEVSTPVATPAPAPAAARLAAPESAPAPDTAQKQKPAGGTPQRTRDPQREEQERAAEVRRLEELQRQAVAKDAEIKRQLEERQKQEEAQHQATSKRQQEEAAAAAAKKQREEAEQAQATEQKRREEKTAQQAEEAERQAAARRAAQEEAAHREQAEEAERQAAARRAAQEEAARREQAKKKAAAADDDEKAKAKRRAEQSTGF